MSAWLRIKVLVSAFFVLLRPVPIAEEEAGSLPVLLEDGALACEELLPAAAPLFVLLQAAKVSTIKKDIRID